MNTINSQSTAAQKFYRVCSKQAFAFDDIGVWAFNKNEAKRAFKSRYPQVRCKDIQASQSDY